MRQKERKGGSRIERLRRVVNQHRIQREQNAGPDSAPAAKPGLRGHRNERRIDRV
jgi:hypothetical protein